MLLVFAIHLIMSVTSADPLEFVPSLKASPLTIRLVDAVNVNKARIHFLCEAEKLEECEKYQKEYQMYGLFPNNHYIPFQLSFRGICVGPNLLMGDEESRPSFKYFKLELAPDLKKEYGQKYTLKDATKLVYRHNYWIQIDGGFKSKQNNNWTLSFNGNKQFLQPVIDKETRLQCSLDYNNPLLFDLSRVAGLSKHVNGKVVVVNHSFLLFKELKFKEIKTLNLHIIFLKFNQKSKTFKSLYGYINTTECKTSIISDEKTKEIGVKLPQDFKLMSVSSIKFTNEGDPKFTAELQMSDSPYGESRELTNNPYQFSKCEQKEVVVECNHLPDVKNGTKNLTDGKKIGSTYTVVCNAKFTLSPQNFSRTCKKVQNKAIWDGSIIDPKCLSNDIKVCKPDPCRNGGSCKVVGKKVKCTCKKGFSGTFCGTNDNLEDLKKSCGVYGLTINRKSDKEFQCTCRKGYIADKNKPCVPDIKDIFCDVPTVEDGEIDTKDKKVRMGVSIKITCFKDKRLLFSTVCGKSGKFDVEITKEFCKSKKKKPKKHKSEGTKKLSIVEIVLISIFSALALIILVVVLCYCFKKKNKDEE